MSTRVRVAIGVLAIFAIAGAFLVWQGSRGDGRVWPVEWSVERQLGPKQARLTVVIDEYCLWKAPRFEEPIVEYEGDRAYVEMRLVPEPEREGPSGCFLNLPIAHPTITLERNLDELTLFDSSTEPPQKRWPRDRPWPHE